MDAPTPDLFPFPVPKNGVPRVVGVDEAVWFQLLTAHKFGQCSTRHVLDMIQVLAARQRAAL